MDANTCASWANGRRSASMKGLELPWPRAYGLAYRRLYENMDIVIPPGRSLLPFEPLPHARTWTENGVWTATSLILDHNHHCGLRVNEDVAADRKRRFPQHAAFIDRLVADLKPRLVHFGGYTHSNPDMRRVVNEGFLAMVAELDEELARVQAGRERRGTGCAEPAAGAEGLHGRRGGVSQPGPCAASAARRTQATGADARAGWR